MVQTERVYIHDKTQHTRLLLIEITLSVTIWGCDLCLLFMEAHIKYNTLVFRFLTSACLASRVPFYLDSGIVDGVKILRKGSGYTCYLDLTGTKVRRNVMSVFKDCIWTLKNRILGCVVARESCA